MMSFILIIIIIFIQLGKIETTHDTQVNLGFLVFLFALSIRLNCIHHHNYNIIFIFFAINDNACCFCSLKKIWNLIPNKQSNQWNNLLQINNDNWRDSIHKEYKKIDAKDKLWNVARKKWELKQSLHNLQWLYIEYRWILTRPHEASKFLLDGWAVAPERVRVVILQNYSS